MLKRRGFTLLEVMIAILMLAIALPALIKAVGSNINNVSHLKDKTIAQFVALNRITELQATHAWPSPGESNGKETMARHEWLWEMSIIETDEKAMRKVEVSVKRARDENPVVTVEGYLSKPS